MPLRKVNCICIGGPALPLREYLVIVFDAQGAWLAIWLLTLRGRHDLDECPRS